MATIFELLGIEPTNDFKHVKKLYLTMALAIHPDKHMQSSLDVQQAKHKAFTALNNAYSLVNEPLKLQAYYEGITQIGLGGVFASPEQAVPLKRREQASQDNSFISMYIPVDVMANESETGELIIDEDPAYNSMAELMLLRFHREGVSETEFSQKFSFKQLTAILTNNSRREPLQVGVDLKEAIAIANEFDRYHHKIIVEVYLPISCFSDNKVSTAKWNGTLTPTINPGHFMLMAKTVFNDENIVAAHSCPISLGVSMRFLQKNIWSEQLMPEKLMLINPCFALKSAQDEVIQDEMVAAQSVQVDIAPALADEADVVSFEDVPVHKLAITDTPVASAAVIPANPTNLSISISSVRFRLSFKVITPGMDLSELRAYFNQTLGAQCEMNEQRSYELASYGRSWAIVQNAQMCHLQYSFPVNGREHEKQVIDTDMLLGVFNELVESLGIDGSGELPEGATEFDIATIPHKKYYPFLEEHRLPHVDAIKACCTKFIELTRQSLLARPACDRVDELRQQVAPSTRGTPAFFASARQALPASFLTSTFQAFHGPK